MIRSGAFGIALCLVPLLGTTTVVWAADTEPSQHPDAAALLGQAPVDAQTPPPIEEPAGVAPVRDEPDETGAEDDAKPWWRLFIFVPVSVLIGIGAAFAHRALPEKSLVSD